METIFKLLKEINKNSGINQRTLSIKCGISLGKVNSDIEDLEFNNFVVKEVKGREHRYSITKKGLNLLEQYLKKYKKEQLQLHIDSKINVKVKKAVILAAGKNKNFNVPVANLNINNISLIERNINILKNNGIENIIVIVGYKSEVLKQKLIDNNIIILENQDYKWTGTMESLAIASPFINDDFILIESDIVIEADGISQIIQHPTRDCILITVESGSGDEALVEIRENKIYKISKDIAQLNRIDGEMIGISKVSYDFYQKMIESYKYNQNPYMNYEYMMLDVSRIYSLGYVKIDNLLWHEIDNEEHYNYVINKLLKKIDKKEKSVLLKNLKEIICKCMNIQPNEIHSITPIGGMTNNNFKVSVKDKFYVLRVPGNGTGEMISRQDEIKNAVYANKIGVDAKLIYFNEDTGIKISKFIENAETLSPDAAKKQQNMKMVCKLLRTLHNSKENMNNNFNIYEKIEKYEKLSKEANGLFYDDYYQIKNKVYSLKNIMSKLDVLYMPCHNDTIAENFIKSGEEKMYLIDWEYAGMNDPMWDLAAYSLENNFNDDEEELFLKIYFNGKVEEKYKKRILINKIYQDFLWSIWTNIKEARGDDFGSYGIDRYNRAKKNLSIILKENL